MSTQSNWEDAMDKTFENITLMVRDKKIRKEENVHKRHILSETLDDIEKAGKQETEGLLEF